MPSIGQAMEYFDLDPMAEDAFFEPKDPPKERITAEDGAFLISLYEQYFPTMQSNAQKYTVDNDSVRDVVQDCAEKLAKHVKMLRKLQPKALGAYISVVIRNTAYSYNRGLQYRDKHVRLTELSDADLPDVAPTPEEALLSGERRAEYYRALDGLDDAERELLLGKYEFELSNEQLADIYGCKPASIRMKLSRARRHAMELLKEIRGDDDE